MIRPNDSLISYTDRYLMARDLCADYCALVRARIEKFCQWCGADIRIDELTNELANDYLGELAAAGMNPRTLSGYRAAILCIWREAFASGDNDHAPLRLRRIKKPALLISAFNHDELRTILAYAAGLKRIHKDGNSAADFWQCAVHIGYSLGARRGDLLKLQRDQIAADGTIRFVQNKTGFLAGGRLSIEAMHFMRRLQSDGPALPWPYKRAAFTRTFKRLRKASGVNRGSFKWLRRSSASYSEAACPGNGSKILGHRSPHIFTQHYEDSTITGAAPVQPPPLV